MVFFNKRKKFIFDKDEIDTVDFDNFLRLFNDLRYFLSFNK